MMFLRKLKDRKKLEVEYGFGVQDGKRIVWFPVEEVKRIYDNDLAITGDPNTCNLTEQQHKIRQDKLKEDLKEIKRIFWKSFISILNFFLGTLFTAAAMAVVAAIVAKIML